MFKFLLEDYLKHNGIDYKSSGKNIGEGWIGVRDCPFCGDSKYHLGINKNSGIFSCWICKKSGNITYLIQELENVPPNVATEIYNNFSITENIVSHSLIDTLKGILNKPVVRFQTMDSQRRVLCLPDKIVHLKEALTRFKSVEKYLHDRGFDSNDVESWGDTWLCLDGKFHGRIIFPVYVGQKLVNYVGRTIIYSPLRYMNCPNSEAIIPIKDCIYNYDSWNVGEPIIIAEGIFDILKIKKLLNKKVVGLFGKQISDNQLLLIRKKDPSKVYLFLDRDAWSCSLDIASKIKMFTNCSVDIITPDLKDPDSYINKKDMEGLFG